MENNSKANFRLGNKSRLQSPKKKRSLCACLKYSSSAIFSRCFTLESGLFLFLGITHSILHHQFIISGSVTGHAIFLSSAENYGQSSLKCRLDILGFPRIIYNINVPKLSEPKKIENFPSPKKKKFNSEIKRARKAEHVSIKKAR